MTIITLEGRRIGSKLTQGVDDSREFDKRQTKAARGSRRLRDAILRLQGLPVPRDRRRQQVIPVVNICPSCHTPLSAKRYLVADIQQTVASYYGLHLNLMTSADRRRDVARARQTAMFLASELTPHSVAEIGRRFNRDHTTVLYAIRQVSAAVEKDHELAFDMSLLRERLSA